MATTNYQEQADNTAYDELIQDIQSELIDLQGGVHTPKESERTFGVKDEEFIKEEWDI